MVASTVQVFKLLVQLQMHSEVQIISFCPEHFHVETWEKVIVIDHCFFVFHHVFFVLSPCHCHELQFVISCDVICGILEFSHDRRNLSIWQLMGLALCMLLLWLTTGRQAAKQALPNSLLTKLCAKVLCYFMLNGHLWIRSECLSVQFKLNEYLWIASKCLSVQFKLCKHLWLSSEYLSECLSVWFKLNENLWIVILSVFLCCAI